MQGRSFKGIEVLELLVLGFEVEEGFGETRVRNNVPDIPQADFPL